jgi:hypothetical protein
VKRHDDNGSGGRVPVTRFWPLTDEQEASALVEWMARPSSEVFVGRAVLSVEGDMTYLRMSLELDDA